MQPGCRALGTRGCCGRGTELGEPWVAAVHLQRALCHGVRGTDARGALVEEPCKRLTRGASTRMLQKLNSCLLIEALWK